MATYRSPDEFAHALRRRRRSASTDASSFRSSPICWRAAMRTPRRTCPKRSSACRSPSTCIRSMRRGSACRRRWSPSAKISSCRSTDMQALRARLGGSRDARRDLVALWTRRVPEGERTPCAPCSRGRCRLAESAVMSCRFSPTTRAVRAALESDTQYGAVVPPMHLTSTFAFKRLRRQTARTTTRAPAIRRAMRWARRSPSWKEARVRSSRRPAWRRSSWSCQLLRCRRSADRAARLLRRHLSAVQRARQARRACASSSSIRPTNAAFAQALALRPKLVWVETPSNPLLRIVDIRATAQQAHAVGAWCSPTTRSCRPVWQQPIALGADLVLHSTTKYLNGHSDVVGGAVISAHPELHEQLVWWANCIGVTGAPFDSYLTLRGLRTLHARMRVHGENARADRAAAVAASQPFAHVYYPGLPSHPQHAAREASAERASARC